MAGRQPPEKETQEEREVNMDEEIRAKCRSKVIVT